MTLDDAAFHLAGEDEPTVRYLSGGRSTLATVTAWIELNRRSWESGGPVRCFGICEAITDQLVGMVEANLAAPGFRAGVANISYGIYPAARGKGYATRAVLLVADYLAEKTDAGVAVIQVHIENEASAAVPVRAGFRRLGERVTSAGERMLTFALLLRPAADQLTISSVCL